MLDFSFVCITLAVVFSTYSIEKYRVVSLLLLINFIYFKVFAGLISVHQSQLPEEATHMVYMLISGLTVVGLVKLKSFLPLYTLMACFSLYNFLIILEYRFGAFGFHANFVPIARAQMVIELLIMFAISKGGRYVWRAFNDDRDYHYFIDRLFAVCFRLGSKRMAG